jgi:NOL1/NOP2/fmu family ribosome biogenesis protein
MAIRPEQAKNVVTFNNGGNELSAYFRGESIPNQGENGWVLIALDGFSLGWGKRVNNVIKNFYPHGLRRR